MRIAVRTLEHRLLAPSRERFDLTMEKTSVQRRKILASEISKAAMDAARETTIMRSDSPFCFILSPPFYLTI